MGLAYPGDDVDPSTGVRSNVVVRLPGRLPARSAGSHPSRALPANGRVRCSPLAKGPFGGVCVFVAELECVLRRFSLDLSRLDGNLRISLNTQELFSSFFELGDLAGCLGDVGDRIPKCRGGLNGPGG